LRESRSEIDRPPARTGRRTRASGVATVCSSARNRWTQRSQFVGIPRNPSQTPAKVASCEIALGVVKLHPVVVIESAHEAAHRRGESALVVPDEVDDVAIRGVGLPICRWWDNPRRALPLHVRRQLTAVHELVQGERRHRRAAPRQWIQHCDWWESHYGWRRRAKTKLAASESERARSPKAKARSKGAAVQSDELRDFPLPLLRFIDPGGVALPESRAPRALTAGGCICH
jgi:hypothetical protein